MTDTTTTPTTTDETECDHSRPDGGTLYVEIDGGRMACSYCGEPKADRPTWEICPDCDGEGTHVNDALSAPSQELRDDPDFMEGYFAGAYDVSCARCGGTGKVRTDRDPGPSRARERAGRLVNEAGEPLEG